MRETPTLNQRVVGSNPTAPTNSSNDFKTLPAFRAERQPTCEVVSTLCQQIHWRDLALFIATVTQLQPARRGSRSQSRITAARSSAARVGALLAEIRGKPVLMGLTATLEGAASGGSKRCYQVPLRSRSVVLEAITADKPASRAKLRKCVSPIS